MKKLINSIFIVQLTLICMAVLFAACKKKHDSIWVLDPQKDAALIQQIQEAGIHGIYFPEGSQAVELKKGVVRLTLPEGYFYVLRTREGDTKGLPGGGASQEIIVTCNCTDGKDCSPAILGDEYFCLMGPECFSCEKTITTKSTAGEEIEVQILGMMNKNVGITLLCDKHVIEEEGGFFAVQKMIRGMDVIHGNAFPELFEDEEFIKFTEDMGEFYAEHNFDPETITTWAYFNIFGNVALVPYLLPEDGSSVAMANGEEYYAKSIPGGGSGTAPKIDCSCSAGECLPDKIWIPTIGTIYYCKAQGCARCTLTKLD